MWLNIQVGSLVEGVGVGREVYVRAVDLSAQQVTLSQPLYAAEGTQEYDIHQISISAGFQRVWVTA